MKETKVKAFAKINLILNMLGEMPNGYHRIESFMQAIELHDDVAVSWEERGAVDGGGGPAGSASGSDRKALKDGKTSAGLSIRLDPGRPDLPSDEGNLAYRAAALMHEAFHPDISEIIDIKITKRIPVAAGLAGGSADGAAVITALARLWDLEPPASRGGAGSGEAPLPKALNDIASKLGSDVPFCLMAQNGSPAAIARGTGTELTPAEPVSAAILLLTSPFGVSTKAVYQELGPEEQGPGAPHYGDLSAFMSARTLEEKVLHSANQLTGPALRVCPKIKERLALLEDPALYGRKPASPKAPLAVRLSGSGPTCYAVLPAGTSEADVNTDPDPGILLTRTLI